MADAQQYEKQLLIKIVLNNSGDSAYTNSNYGIVDDIMYVCTGDSDITVGDDIYKANLITSIRNIVNEVDLLGSYGGYYPFNEFQFQMIDLGMFNTLRNAQVNIYRATVYVSIMINSVVWDTYVGIVDNISTTGEQLRIVCEDISIVKDASLARFPYGFYIGHHNVSDGWNTEPLDLSYNTTTLAPIYSRWAIIFPGLTSIPSDNRFDDYSINPGIFTTSVTASGITSYDGQTCYYIDFTAELESTILSNPNYGSLSSYETELTSRNIEVVSDDKIIPFLYNSKQSISKTIKSFTGYKATKISSGTYEDTWRVYCIEDTTELAVNTPIVFTTPAPDEISIEDLITLSGNASINTITDHSDISPMIKTTVSGLPSGILSTGEVQQSNTNYANIPLGYSTGGTRHTIVVPDEIEFDSVSSTDWTVVGGVTPDTMQYDFFDFKMDNDNGFMQLRRNSGQSDTSAIDLVLKVKKENIPTGQWSLGFLFSAKSITDNLYINNLASFKLTIYNSNNTNVFSKEVDLQLSNNFANYSIGSDYRSILGSSPVMFDPGTLLSASGTNSYLHNKLYMMSKSLGDISFSSADVVRDDYLYFKFEFTVSGDEGDLYFGLPGFYFLQENEIKALNTYTIDDVDAEITDSVDGYQSYSSTIYALYFYSRYDTSSYIDIKSIPNTKMVDMFYNTAYPVLSDVFTDLLDNSGYILTNDILGKRKMLLHEDLISSPSYITKEYYGSLDRVALNSSYASLCNIPTYNFADNSSVSFYIDSDYSNVYTQSENSEFYLGATNDTLRGDEIAYSSVYNGAGFTNEINEKNVNQYSIAYPDYIIKFVKIYGYLHFKFRISEDLRSYLEAPVRMGDWISFRDLRYTNDETVYGMVHGVDIDYNNSKVYITCTSPSIRPDSSVLDEQIGGTLLEEQIGGTELDEQTGS